MVTVLLMRSTSHCETRPAPIHEKDMVGAWVGCAQGCTEFYRLELGSDQKGTLVILDPELKHETYSISEWKVEAEKLQVVLKPRAKAEVIELKSLHLDQRYVEIEIRGVALDWKRNVKLFNEKDWDERMRRSRAASGGKPPAKQH